MWRPDLTRDAHMAALAAIIRAGDHVLASVVVHEPSAARTVGADVRLSWHECVVCYVNAASVVVALAGDDDEVAVVVYGHDGRCRLVASGAEVWSVLGVLRKREPPSVSALN
jgi:hypothetical protein